MVFQVSGNDDDVAVSLVWNAKEHLFVAHCDASLVYPTASPVPTCCVPFSSR